MTKIKSKHLFILSCFMMLCLTFIVITEMKNYTDQIKLHATNVSEQFQQFKTDVALRDKVLSYKLNHIVMRANEAIGLVNLQNQIIDDLEIQIKMKDIDSLQLIVTAYTNSEDECDKDPNITAVLTKVRPGIVAVSSDLLARGWTFGRRVYIEGVGIFTIEDRMNRRWTERMDIFLYSKNDARKFGKRKLTVVLLPKNV